MRRRADGHFGVHDPICWPQHFQQSGRSCWLVAVRRRPEHVSEPLKALWTPLGSGDVVSAPNALHSTFCVVSESFREPLARLVENQCLRVKVFLGANTEASRQPEWLSDCMRQAFERLRYPSTERDLVCQVACVQRFWLLTDAWLEYYTRLTPLYSFTDPVIAERPTGVRDDLMGAFTTSSTVAAQLLQLRVPVWFYRRDVHFTGEEVVLTTTRQPVSPPDSAGSVIGGPIYIGFPGEAHISAISANSARYVDVECNPIPALNTSLTTPAVVAPIAHTPLRPVEEVATSSRAQTYRRERTQPCEYPLSLPVATKAHSPSMS